MTTKLTLKKEKGNENSGEPINLISSRQLLGQGGALYIRHQDRLYVLRITKNGKLILN